LKIAWQYRKYIQQQQRSDTTPMTGLSSGRPSGLPRATSKSASAVNQRANSSKNSAQKALAAGISREWCHQYDLSRGLTPAQLQGSKFETYCCQAEQGCPVLAASQAAASFVQRFQQAQGAGPLSLCTVTSVLYTPITKQQSQQAAANTSASHNVHPHALCNPCSK